MKQAPVRIVTPVSHRGEKLLISYTDLNTTNVNQPLDYNKESKIH